MDIEKTGSKPEDKHDFATAILNQKKAPNKLAVEEATNDDNTTVYLTAKKLQELGLFRGDPVLIRGKRRKTTIAIALQENGNALEDGKIRMNKVMRNNLKLRLGDLAVVNASTQTPNLSKIHILPYADSIEGLSGDLATTYLIPY